MTSSASAHSANKLLSALKRDELERLLPRLEVVDLNHRAILIEAGEPITQVFFPHAAVICLMAVMHEGGTAETATIGPEGAVGFESMLGASKAMGQALVQVPGKASVISVADLRQAMDQSATLRRLMQRYIAAFIMQVNQSVACNSLHRLEERCCRWLLMAHDRAGRDSFALTQEFLAEMLGVYRPTVTIVARTLQNAGLIRYSRGMMQIVDRAGLEEAACECYGVVRNAYRDIFR